MFDPTLIKFPRAHSIHQIEINLESYLTSNNNLIIVFEDWITQLNVKYHQHRIDIFLNDESQFNPCVFLSLTEETFTDNEITAHINFISAQHDCDMPSTQAGTWLIRMVDALVYALGCSIAQLYDGSQIECPNSSVFVSLIFLRIFAGRFSSWYENFGFQTQDKAELVQLMQELYHLPIANFTSDVLEDYPALQNETLGSYMNRLWHMNCHAYDQMFKDLARQTPLIDQIVDLNLNEYTKRYR